MSCYLEDEFGIPILDSFEKNPTTTNLVVIAGIGDRKTFLFKLNLNRLLGSLQLVNC